MIIERFEHYAFAVDLIGTHWISFLVSKVLVDENGVLFFGSGTSDFISDFDTAKRFLIGSIKWDGCSNWTFGDPKHFCGRKAAASIGPLIDHLYEIASQRVEAYDPEEAE